MTDNTVIIMLVPYSSKVPSLTRNLMFRTRGLLTMMSVKRTSLSTNTNTTQRSTNTTSTNTYSTTIPSTNTYSTTTQRSTNTTSTNTYSTTIPSTNTYTNTTQRSTNASNTTYISTNSSTIPSTNTYSTTQRKATKVPHVCIIGSGPAGFYTAQQILKSHPSACVDMYERLPVPFGLVRYGVAPDHPEVKNCINTFTQTARNPRFTFLGNVSVGPDNDSIPLAQLRSAYHAVVMCYGSSRDRTLNIPGECLPNVVSARRLVGWYNGLPEDTDLDVDLGVESVVVVGQGNVAVDVARILLTPVDALRKTDIPEAVLNRLSESRVRRVTLVGRRGPQHAAFTIKELREMINLPGCKPHLNPHHYTHLRDIIPDLPRPRKRLLELLAKTGLDPPNPKLAASYTTAQRTWSLSFLRSPIQVLASEHQGVIGIELAINRLEGEQGRERAVTSTETEVMECGLVLRSIGYQGVSIDPSIPFNDNTGTIQHIDSRVMGMEGMYVSGWIGTGPVGVILSTMTSGFSTGKAVVADMDRGRLDISEDKPGQDYIRDLLAQNGVRAVNFNEWSTLNHHEETEGARLGKPREKVTSISAMLKVMNH
ncbi:hypothetical protein Pcinc_017022 [Petrolisthes cinctipes]|uniref:NADPH:adrenodoxin oxidoreductase, mitochondrial n=1 Tax=Petrolisthes cinctipes TaxID=88211 RepID=A0AAE1KNB1_PETCI|nr:hypothetical protein Pcinc_017022 [Petrolisthes cinctipes]